jgi:hypothetical protein
MTFEAALREYLLASEVIAAIAGDRVHPVRLRIPVKQEQTAVTPTLAASLVFSLEGRRVDESIDEAGLVLISNYDVEAWATDFDQAVQLSDAARRHLLDLFGGQTVAEDDARDELGARVTAIEYLTESDSFDAERGIFVRTGTYVIRHEDQH